MRHGTPTRVQRPWLTVLLAAVLLVNTLVLGRSLNLYPLPGERGELAQARQSADLVAAHMLSLARGQGLAANSAVEDSVLQLQLAVKRARTVDEIAQVLQRGIQETQTIIAREEEASRKDAVLAVLSASEAVIRYKGKASISISREEGKDLKVIDTAQLVTSSIVGELSRHQALQHPFILVVEVDNGQLRIPTQRTLADKVTGLEQELGSLRMEIQSIRSQAGLSPMSGGGVRVKLYDAFGGYTEDQIVHDADVRDVINELSAAGAAGIAVGEERIVATSSVRCAGPVILVNHRAVQVDPVVISAVGDAGILASSLHLIRSTLLITKGVKLEVEKLDSLTLPAYTPLR